jgi:RHS repeat-associated protein
MNGEALLYFGGKLIGTANTPTVTSQIVPFSAMVTDRLGSVRVRGAQSFRFYPYGQELPSATVNGREKFGTYFRDTGTGLDYANQRYHAPGFGRFMTADPYMASGGASEPGSWNRYAYVGGDPVNYTDVEGLQRECIASICFDDTSEPIQTNPGPPSPVPQLPRPPISLGQPGPGPYAAPVWTGFSKRDGQVARNAQDMANKWVKNQRCDHALRSYGVKSVGDALGTIQFSGRNQNVWNGTNSEYITNFADAKGTVYTLGVNQFFAKNRAHVGAIVTHTNWGRHMFLGYAFFDPGIAGVKTGYHAQAQALIIMHEAVHLAGFGDNVFGGSKQLSNLLIDNCYPVIKSYLGGLTQ